MPGQEVEIHKFPSHSPNNSLPSLSTMIGLTPKKGRVAEPGLSGVVPAMGAINIPPVSVCHQVSITGHSLLPITS